MKKLLYRILKVYVQLGLFIYFKKYQLVNRNLIPADGPVLFVANHQNAFLDALLVVCGIKRSLWFLARGDVFKKKWAVTLLTFLKIKPVYRFRDGHAAIRNNASIFKECVSILQQGECLLIFGEADHNEPYTYRGLTRGFAQIATAYFEQTGRDLPIVPVGIHYEMHEAFRSRVLVTFGEPVSFLQQTKEETDTRTKMEKITKVLSEAIQPLILIIPLDGHYTNRLNYLIQNRYYQKNMINQLETDRKVIAQWKGEEVPKRLSLPIFRWFDPLFLYGRLVHFIPHIFLWWMERKLITDNQFIGSLKFATGIFMLPIYYTLFGWFLFGVLPIDSLWFIVVILSFPLSGLYVYDKNPLSFRF